MRDEDGRHVHLLVQAAQPLAQLGADARVEGAERLVEQQHLRLDRERAGESHALPLAAGELGRIAAGERLQLHELEQLSDAGVDLLLRPLADRQAERDVVAHRHVLERGVVLEDEADAALLRRDPGRVLAEDHDLALVRLLESRDDAEQRGLAASARAEERGQRARFDVERHVFERGEAVEALRDSVDDDGH